MRSRQSGFTLIELLVVILIIAILAAIAVPVFLEQRERGWEAQHQSAMKNAATAIETYAGDNNGSYAGLDGQVANDAADALATTLASYGFQWPDFYTHATDGFLRIEANAGAYCINVRHKLLTASSDWRRSTYQSSIGAPRPTPDSCPDL